MKASIVYWYSKDQLRRDGGGLRALAWEEALTALGYDVEIVPLWTLGGASTKTRWLSSLKRAVIPMPLSRDIPDRAVDADLVVTAVPATFTSALSKVSGERLIFDWTDLWSVNARTIGDAKLLSRPGGRAQSRLWSRREKCLAESDVRAHTYAGWGDFAALESIRASPGLWLPTPVASAKVLGPRGGAVSSIGFVGNLDYPPNQLSLRWFLDQYGSALSRKGVRVVVAGFGSAAVAQWGYDVEVLGEVADVAQLYSRVDAAVVPVNFGGGIKVKAVEAMSYGLPVFATSHVRSGFSPDFAPYLHGMDDLLSCRPVAAVPRETFGETFSTSAFCAEVARIVAR